MKGANKLQLLMLVLIGVSILLLAVVVLQNRQVIQAYRLRELEMVAEILATDHEAAVAGVRQFLIVLADQLQQGVYSQSTCAEILERETMVYPYFLNLGVIDMNGNLICSGVPTKVTDYRDDPAFQEFLSSGGFVTSGYRIGKSTGRPTVKFFEPLYDRDKSLAGAVFLSFATEWLNGFSPSLPLPNDVTVTKFDQDGIVFMRYPNPALWSGTDQRESDLYKIASELGEGTAEVRGLDGTKRLYYFRPVYVGGRLNAYVAVGL